MGCDREHFVVKWDQQCTQDEAAGKGRVGIVVGKSDLLPKVTWPSRELAPLSLRDGHVTFGRRPVATTHHQSTTTTF